MSTVNKVGFEAEVFLTNKGKIVIPSEYGLPTDDYLLLGEVRAEPGRNAREAYLNFILEYERFKLRAMVKGLKIKLGSYGVLEIPVKQHNDVLRTMGNKEISHAENIYPDIDILSFSDNIVDVDKKSKTYCQIIKVKKSCGFHIHFSSTDKKEIITYHYEPIKINAHVESIRLEKTLYEKGRKNELSSSVSRITMPVIREFVTKLDDKFYSKYCKVETRFRRKGFFEEKSHGFEYRSLPFTNSILKDLFEISKFSFSLFDLL